MADLRKDLSQFAGRLVSVLVSELVSEIKAAFLLPQLRVSPSMAPRHIVAYRSVVREVYKASMAPRSTRNPTIASHFRVVFATPCKSEEHPQFHRDMENALTFMQSQRMHKILLERYNPLHDMSVEERVKATARRVGLDMPVDSNKTKEE